MTHRRAFTLVEMLVVVSIIVVLIAMLLPALGRTKESTRRSICQANIHSLVMAHLNYAVGNGGRLMSSQVTTGQPGLGGYAVYGSSWPSYAPLGQWRAHGYLAFKGFVSPQTLYCPSWTHRMNYHQSDGSGGGWPEDLNNLPAGQVWIQTHYHYRSTFGINNAASDWRPARISSSDGYRALMADAFSDPSRGTDVCHRTGYNVGHVDGSTRWLEDPTHYVRDFNGGKSYHAGASAYALQEQVWQTFFDR